MEPLELLAEPGGLPAFRLPPGLADRYPGTLGFPEEWLYANFVETLDGVVAMPDVPRANRLIADGSDADHFVMALLRACAHVVLIGAGTLRASPSSRWLPESVFPAAAPELAMLRSALRLEPKPRFAVVTSGVGPLALPEGTRESAIVLTTHAGAERLAGDLHGVEVVPVSDGVEVDVRAAVAALRERGLLRILCEGGPTLFASCLRERLVDELFLTVSPVVAGRVPVRETRGLVEGEVFLPDVRIGAALRGVRRSDSHLFLRYLLPR
ncbi:MAG TPA: dihydrofolate reductase family protein [Gaiellaceae bacterium]